MQISITGQTTLENDLKVFSVRFIDGQKDWSEEFIYRKVTELLRRLRRDAETRKELQP